MSSDHEWFVELNGEETIVSSSRLREFLAEAKSLPQGKLWLGKDGGPRPWWHSLLGTRKRYVQSIFALEWYSDAAALIFHDEDWSEYRALRPDDSSSFTEGVRAKISHGETEPTPENECISKELAFKAITEALSNGGRPTWLSYKVVK